MFRAPEAAAIIADRLLRPLNEILDISDAAAPPATAAGLNGYEFDALLLLAVMAGATPATAEATAAAILALRDEDGTPPHKFVAAMLRELAMRNGKSDATVAAFKSTVAAVKGDNLAVLVTLFCTDGQETIVFYDGDGYRPDQDEVVGLSLVLPGKLLFRMAQDLLNG